MGKLLALKAALNYSTIGALARYRIVVFSSPAARRLGVFPAWSAALMSAPCSRSSCRSSARWNQIALPLPAERTEQITRLLEVLLAVDRRLLGATFQRQVAVEATRLLGTIHPTARLIVDAGGGIAIVQRLAVGLLSDVVPNIATAR